MAGSVAVFDVGKTNVKLVVFGADGRVVVERSRPNASLPPTPTGLISASIPRAPGRS